MLDQKESFLRLFLPRLQCAGHGREGTVRPFCAAHLTERPLAQGAGPFLGGECLACLELGDGLNGMAVFGAQSEGSGHDLRIN